nr:hypothetical protein [Tanacetum cinerariifolium]
MRIPTVGQTGEFLPLPPLASIWKDLRLLGILFRIKKLREKLSQEEDTEEQAFEEFSSTLDNVLEKLSQGNESPDDFYGLMYDTDDDASISGKSYQPIQVVVAQNNVHEEVAEEVIEMANDQVEALSSDKEVTDECLDDEHVEERRPSKRIRVTQEEIVKDEKPKKG